MHVFPVGFCLLHGYARALAVHGSKQTEDEQIDALVLDPLDHMDGGNAEHDMGHLEVGHLVLADRVPQALPA